MEINNSIPQLDYDGYTITPLQIPKQNSNSNSFPPTNQSIQEPYPSKEVILEACKIYFLHCYNQPFSFFDEDRFMSRFHWDGVPMYLQLAILATSIRYSSKACWRDCKEEAIDKYAYATKIKKHITAGRKRASWVKVGMAIRISQDLDLMRDTGLNIPESEQEERRRLFWSLYLLERIICCSSGRPLAIIDSDCHVRLPSETLGCPSEASSRLDATTTLPAILKYNETQRDTLGNFSSAVLMASAASRATQYAFRDEIESLPPWDHKSEYGTIQSTLFLFTSQMRRRFSGSTMQQQDFLTNGKLDQRKVGHFLLARAFFHLTNCMLNHPFLLALKLRKCHFSIPPSWLRGSRHECFVHSLALSDLLVQAKALNCGITAFFCYCVMVAGSIQVLFLDAEDPTTQARARECVQRCKRYLDEVAPYYKIAESFATGLQNFLCQSTKYRTILKSYPFADDLSPTDINILRSVVDFGVMSTITSSNSPLNLSSSPADDEPSPDYSMWLHLEDTPETSSMMNNSIEGLAGLPPFLSSAS
uniref:Putative transcriptional regulatory protein n=1 Tax=Talaromyces marneffei PM1 TaxID=1077442 RepID=A0A093V564_TALMA